MDSHPENIVLAAAVVMLAVWGYLYGRWLWVTRGPVMKAWRKRRLRDYQAGRMRRVRADERQFGNH